MENFMENFNTIKPTFAFADLDSTIMLMNPQFPELSNASMDDSSLMPCSNGAFLHQKNEFQQSSCVDSYSDFPPPVCGDPPSVPLLPSVPIKEKRQGSNKRKHATTTTDSTSASYSMQPFEELGDVEKILQKKKSGKARKGRGNEKHAEKPSEVVHVRARRGQATDSHSLAERVRREKINEKMRFLQDLVPGCYKAMGMAVMLDEIINYVQSLQNQVEFLSMKLSAASTFYDFNMDVAAVDVSQMEPNVMDGCDGQEMDRVMHGGYGGCACFHSTMHF